MRPPTFGSGFKPLTCCAARQETNIVTTLAEGVLSTLIDMISFNLVALGGRFCCSHPHFTDEETEVHRV